MGKRLRHFAVALLAGFVVWLLAGFTLSAGDPVRVGIYQNAPLVFLDEEGRPSGFYVDLLEAIAAEEGWDLEYVECSFSDCLAMLERGDIDLMTAIAYSEEREQRFDFNREIVLANWGQMYIREGGPQAIPDLEGRSVAVVREDIYYTRFRTLIDSLDVSCRFVELDDYGQVMERVAAGEADAGLVARLYGLRHERTYDLVRSPIRCCPSELHFAAPKGEGEDLLGAIDRHIAAWKQDPGSVYYRSLDRWFEGMIAEPALLARVPEWVRWAVVVVTAVAVLGIGGNLLLRAQVRARTRELEAAEARYRGLFERVPVGLYSATPEGEIVEANLTLVELLRYPDRESLLGRNVRDLLADEAPRGKIWPEQGEEVCDYETQFRRADGTSVWVRGHARAVRDEEGRVVRYEGSLEDIDEQKAAGEAVRNQARRLEALRQIGLELAAELDLESLLRSIVERAVGLVGGKSGNLYLLRPDEEVLDLIVSVGTVPRPERTFLYPGEGLSGKVWKENRALVVEDYNRWEGRASIYEGFPCAAVVGAPIRWGDETLGVIDVASDQPGVFSAEDAELLSLFALQAAIAIRNARQVAALKEERERMALLHRLGERITASLDVHAVAQQALEDICAVVGALQGVVLAWDEEIERLVPVAVSGRDTESVAALADQLRLRLDGGSLAGWVAANRRSVIVPDVTVDEHWLSVPGLDDWVHSALSVPLVTQEELVGVLSIYSERKHFFSEDHRILVESAAAVVAAAIANARLYEREREQRRLAEALVEAAAAVSSTLDLDQVLDRILEQVSRVVPNDATNVMLISGDEVRIARWRGYEKFGDAADFVSSVVFRLSEVPNLRAMKVTREPIVIPDTTAYPGWVQVPEQSWLRSYAGVPIVVRGEVIGFLNVDSATPGFFNEAHLAPLKAFADYAASAIHNARLYEEARRRALEQETLREAALALSTVRDPEEAVERILAELERVVPYDSASIQWLEGNRLRIIGGRGFPNLEELLGITFDLTRDDNPNRWVVETRRPVIEEDVSARYAEFRREPHAQARIRSWLGVPMMIGERLIGMIALDKREPGFYTEAHARLAEAFAAQAAVALENARLHAELQAYAGELEKRVTQRTTQLRRAQERLQAILDAAGEGIFVTDSRGRIEYLNPAAERMTGYSLEELRGHLPALLLAEEEERERMKQVGQMLSKGGAWRGEIRMRRKDGTVFDAALVIAPIPDESGDPSGYVTVVEDVTPFRELDRTKTRFIHNISHEFRTPLATAKLYAELIRRQPASQREHLVALEGELDHLSTLVEGILEVARLDAGRMALRLRVLSLNDLVLSAMEQYRVLAQEKGLEIESRLAESSPVVEADPVLMKRVLDNLLTNAIRYTLSGGRIVVATGTAQVKGRTWATITVSDTGIGIPEEELPHIFERFFRGEEPRRMQISGTGLGLSIVQELVERHGGFVTVESEVGEGSTFTVWLPMARPEDAASASPEPV